MSRLQLDHANTERRVKLRAGKRQAIATLDFESAEQFDHQFKEQKRTESIDLANEITEEFIRDVATWAAQAKAKVNEKVRKGQKACRDVSFKYHRLFTDLKQQHLAALAQLETQYADARLRENDRRNPEQIAMLEEAKRFAIQGLYQKARKRRDQSRELGQRELERRLAEVEAKFTRDRSDLLDSQAEALRNLNRRFVDESDSISRKTDESVQRQYVRRDEKIRELFASAVDTRTKKTGTKNAKDLWTRLDAECTKLSFANPVPDPEHVARAEADKKSAANSRIQSMVSLPPSA
jgi:hypothetical protein